MLRLIKTCPIVCGFAWFGVLVYVLAHADAIEAWVLRLL